MSLKKKLSPTQIRVLDLFRESAGKDSVVTMAKSEMAEVLEVNPKTIDRAIMELKREGLIDVVPRYGDNGGQLANGYRVIR